ncbi:UTRA domain-containing protein [Dictyobacter arantiisoli]|uniref:UTRA domain-containing protein n=1 Tax=Dictyobacter arantiisoli TaxID=2014874 RepID=UPI00155A4DDE|nr:UTRA domain-containing protein [Dictyobacter arantiisoli]
MQPSDIRANTKTAQAYLDIRKKILNGTYKVGQVITPKSIDNDYKTSNTSTQIILLRLAGEGLIKIRPITERTGLNNAAINEYKVADLNVRNRMFSSRHSGFMTDVAQENSNAHLEVKALKIQYADAEIASLLNIGEGDNIIFLRSYQYQNANTLVAISDTYLPFWYAEIMPELEKPDTDLYKLMFSLGKRPFWCTETIDIVQSTVLERGIFGMSTDDPSALLKIIRRAFDEDGSPLSVDFLTDRGDTYRLHYSFPLFADGIPEPLRDR